jgi:VCBS repeat-containing protein
MTSSSTPRNVVFIDGTVPDLQDLLDGLAPGEQAFVLDPSSDGMQQIASILAANDLTDLSSISIIGHGSSGAIEVGDTTLDDADLSAYTPELAAIGGALAPGGDLQLYACDTAAGAAGQQFIADLSQYAGGANVAAATQDIGQTAGGENWTLDATAGTPAAAPVVPFTEPALDAFQGTLALGTAPEVWFVGSNTNTNGTVTNGDVSFGIVGSTATSKGTVVNVSSASSPLKDPVGIAIDPAAGHYFVTDEQAGPSHLNEILEGNINGSGTPTAIYTTGNGGLDPLGGIALDPQNGRLYFSVGDKSGSGGDTGIYSIAETGGPASELINLSSGVQGANALAIDAADNLLFFTNGGSGETVDTIEVANLTTGAIINSALATYSGTQTPYGIAIDLVHDTLYWTTIDFSNNANNAVFSAQYSTGGSVSLSNVQTLATTSKFNPLTGVATDGSGQQYWVSGSNDVYTGSANSLYAGSAAGPASLTAANVAVVDTADPAVGLLAFESVPSVQFDAAENSPTYIGGGSPIRINDVSVTNADGLNLAGATEAISSYFVAGDMLNFTNQSGISGSYNASTGVLTLSGDATLAAYQTALDSVTYSFSGGGDPTNGGADPQRYITWTVTDGSLTQANPEYGIYVVHTPPAVVAGGTAIFRNAGSPVVLDAALTASDPDSSGNLTGAVVQIGGFITGDTLNFTGQNGISGTFNATTATLTLSGKSSVDNYQAALDSITYSFSPANGDPTGGGSHTSRTINWSVNDGVANSATATSSLNLVDAPLPTTVTETATVTSDAAVSGAAGAALAGDSGAPGYTLSVSDVTGGTLGSATHGTYGDLTLNANGSFSYAAAATSAETANIAAVSGQLTDAFTYSVSDGHGGVTSSTLDVDLNATKPSISSIAFNPSSGDLAVHASETITLSLSNAGVIGNPPTLTLNDGGTATYDAAASTSTSWVFHYTVGASDTDVASLAVSSVNLNGTTLTNPSGVAAVTSLPVTGLAQSGPQIDTTTPAFTAVTEIPSSGEIGFGANVTFTLTLNDPVTVDTTNGAPTLSLNDNGTATYDAAASTGTSLVFDYTLSGSDTADVTSLQATLFNLDNAVIANGAGTAANVSLTGLSQNGPQVSLPHLTGALATVPAGTYGPGEQMELLLEFNKAVTVSGDTVTLSLNDGGTATLDTANTAALDQFGLVAFDYKVADNAQDVTTLAVTSIDNGSTIEDNLGDPGQFPNGLPSFAGVAIDPAAPSQDNVPCYCRGTLIAAEQGNVPVERLAIGDEVMTASGALRPIKWIGTRSYSGRFIVGSKDILPVCFKAGSLGEGLPQRDLWISPHHAMYFENESGGVLIEARDLLNGVSIVQAEYVEKVEYFHIELETHDVIIAEGALSETFVDIDSRGMFRNAYEYSALYAGEDRTPARYHAPRLDRGYEVEAVRQRLARQAGLSPAVDQPSAGALRGYVDLVSAACIAGWAQNIDHAEAPVCLDIVAGGRLIGQVLANRYRGDLQRAGLGSGRHSFEFTPPAGLGLSPGTIEVRRSIDGAGVKFSAASRRALQQLAVA